MADESEKADFEINETSVMRRKLAAARDGQSDDSGQTVLRALRLSLARSALALCELPLAVIGAKQLEITRSDLADRLSDDYLLVLLDGPAGQVGAVGMDTATVTALVQQQTTGQVSGQVDQGRSYTNTDAAMTAPLIDQMLNQAAELAESVQNRKILDGFRFGARVDNVRMILLSMTGERYNVIELSLDLALGRVQGALCLILPVDVPMAVSEENAAEEEVPCRNIGEASGSLRVELTAVACRLTVPLDQLSGLRPGHTLLLPENNFNKTELISVEGKVVALGKLGQASGARAVRVSQPRPSPELSELNADEFSAHVGRVSLPAATLTPGMGEEEPAGQPNGTAEPEQPMRTGEPVTIPDNRQDSGQLGEFDGMNPGQVAAEITQLAGLQAPDTRQDDRGKET